MDAGKINTVAAVAKSTEQKSAKAFKVSQQGHQQHCEQLTQLQTFKQEYETRLGVIGEQGMDARQLQDYRLFLNKLNQAIEKQSEEVQASEESLGKTREQWLSESRHRSALDHLVDQRHKQHVQARDKAEQKESDEKTLTRMVTGVR